MITFRYSSGCDLEQLDIGSYVEYSKEDKTVNFPMKIYMGKSENLEFPYELDKELSFVSSSSDDSSDSLLVKPSDEHRAKDLHF